MRLTSLAALCVISTALPFATGAVAQQTVDDSAGSCALTATPIASGIEHPWAVAFLGDGHAAVTERGGTLWVVDLTTGELTEVAGVPAVTDNRQGGLLDLITAPDFATSGTVFFSFAEPRGGGNTGTSIARATLAQWDGAAPTLEDTQILFQQNDPDGSGFHFGSRIVALPDGTLAFTIGDRGTDERAQDPFDHAGAVLRIAADGSVPADNPFADGAEAAPEIWSTGHRNPQGAALDAQTGVLWTVEHGARGGDEINQPQAGLNYGWPTISYGVHYSGRSIGVGTEADGLQQPVYFWDPSIAPSGMAIMRDSEPFAGWDGDMLVGALRAQTLVRLDRQAGQIVSEERLFDGMLGRIRDVRQGPDGAIWLLTDEPNGSLYRVTPTNGTC
ncbi:MAG: PQQ-dependent sugar dehydrogenase [Devosiaceae bacterium]|nr:PQQ-dependent sugar dehydrogenase [Devosiaceae bacterium MH13]